MEATHQCNLCKELLEEIDVLEHMSAVHGVVFQEVENSEFSKEENDHLTEHLMKIKGSKINN
jgi:hypothetical protein